MIERYLNGLDRALAERGVPSGLRSRFLSEVRDHLLEAQAEERPVEFGDPDELAQQVVDELATAEARRTALLAVATLAPAAGLYVLLIGLLGGAAGSPDILSGKTDVVSVPAAIALLVAPQISLAAGGLALLRVLRRRSHPLLPGSEVRVLVRRASTALAFGAATVALLALYAYEYEAGLAWWWRDVAYVGALVLALPLAAVAGGARRTGRLRAATPGGPGDVFVDLPDARVIARTPWRFCLLFAGAVAALALAGGAVGGAADEGLRNAIAEAVAVTAGFATLGRFLGLRR